MKEFYKITRATSIEVCHNLEECRKSIISLQPISDYQFSVKDVIESLESAIVEFAAVIGNDDPKTIHSILDSIDYTGVRNFDDFDIDNCDDDRI
ncbi:MAG: hypothetical protein MJZ16_12345 [Bacteroidales bacterium]|nr:hypothetical protein [Bacteroidales bacterium]